MYKFGTHKEWVRASNGLESTRPTYKAKDYVEPSFSKIFWGIIEEEPPHVRKHRFRNGVRWATVK